jgi:hypothetical protein
MVAQRAVEQTMVAIPAGEAPWAPEPPMVLKADGWAAAGAQQGSWQAWVAQLPVQGSEQKHIDRPASPIDRPASPVDRPASLGSDACCWVDCNSTAATARLQVILHESGQRLLVEVADALLGEHRYRVLGDTGLVSGFNCGTSNNPAPMQP